MKKADAIFIADLHLMEHNPICRTDFLPDVQIKKLKALRRLQKQHQCPVFVAGDVFDTWKPSPHLLSIAFKFLPDNIITIYGNHDLPQNSLELRYKSGLHVLESSNTIQVLKHGSWGQVPGEYILQPSGRRVGLWHFPTYFEENPYGTTVGSKSALRLLKKYPFDVLVTGDNHTSFVVRYKGKLLVNPGSMLRTTAAQIQHRPAAFLYYADANDVEVFHLPAENGVIKREHLEIKQAKDERIKNFIEACNKNYAVDLSYMKNLENFLQNNKVKASVKKIIYATLEKR